MSLILFFTGLPKPDSQNARAPPLDEKRHFWTRDRFAEYSTDVLSEVFSFGDMEYFAGIKLFNRVIDRLEINMEQQKRYEVFDRIYTESMQEKKDERDRCRR